MRFIAIMLVLLLSGVGLAQAETWYVTDQLEITLRTGPELDRKITAMLKSGQSIEIIDKGEEWSQVRLPSGREGWVLNRFIQQELPVKMQFESLQKKYNDLLSGADEPLQKLKEVNSENIRLRTELSKTKRDFGALQKSYKELRETTADARRIKTERDQLSRELADQTKETRRLKSDLAIAEKKSTQWWFIAGAGVLFFGFVIGFAVRLRRKRSSLY